MTTAELQQICTASHLRLSKSEASQLLQDLETAKMEVVKKYKVTGLNYFEYTLHVSQYLQYLYLQPDAPRFSKRLYPNYLNFVDRVSPIVDAVCNEDYDIHFGGR